MNENTNQTTATGISGLLRDPAGYVEHARDTGRFWPLVAFLVGTTLVGSGLFGFSFGAFVDAKVAALDAAKMMGVVAFSFALCFPTFYVFACISGSTLKPLRLLAFGLVCTATLGCLLAALAPIMWLFAVSTEWCGFIVVFAALLAGVAVCFAQRPIDGAVRRQVIASAVGFRVWFFVFVVVALQTVTLVRPMLSPIGAKPSVEGKCFFFEHFVKMTCGK